VNTLHKDDLKRHTKLQKEISLDKSYDQKDIEIRINGRNESSPMVDKIIPSNALQNMQKRCRTQVAGYNQLVGGDAISMVVMNLREMVPRHTFNGNVETSNNIRKCNTNKD